MCIRSSMGGVWDVCVCLWVLWDVDDMRFLHTNSFYFVLLAVSSRFECCQAFYIANCILHYKICIPLNNIIVKKGLHYWLLNGKVRSVWFDANLMPMIISEIKIWSYSKFHLIWNVHVSHHKMMQIYDNRQDEERKTES